MRVRGLKQGVDFPLPLVIGSHPVRVRGLKHMGVEVREVEQDVAPRAGAWVETTCRRCSASRICVAPRAGAWVETCLRLLFSWLHCVAPRAGAWVETEAGHEFQKGN